jgi:hypothetical protein
MICNRFGSAKLPHRVAADHLVAVKSLPLMIANEPLRV